MSYLKAYGKVLGWVLVNNIIGPKGQKLIGTRISESARYCYSIWMRHFVLMNQACNTKKIPKVVAEIGPGESLGTGFAALLSGCEKYYALDVVSHSALNENIQMFDEIVEMFRNKEDIPDEREFPNITPKLDSYSFPDFILSDSDLSLLLAPERIKYIRNNIYSINNKDACIQYHVPWYDLSIIQEKSVDFLFSQAVLEHVDDLPLTYNRMKKWLNEDGVLSHSIDFRCHSTATKWNGHWSYSDITWKIIRGRAIFLINRKPLSFHLKCLDNMDFELIYSQIVHGHDGIKREKLAKNFQKMSESDFTTSVAYLVLCNRHVDND